MDCDPPVSSARLRQVLSRCVCLNMRKAARAVTQRYDEALADSGALSTQLPLLVTVGLRGPVNTTDLAEALVMDRTAVSRNLGRLEREGWVRSAAGEDRRTREAALTDAGWEVVRRAIPLWEKAQTEATGALGEEGLDALVSMLDTVREAARS